MHPDQHVEIHQIQPSEFAVYRQCTVHACQSGQACQQHGNGRRGKDDMHPEQHGEIHQIQPSEFTLSLSNNSSLQ